MILLLAAFLSAALSASAAEPMNVVVVDICSARADHMGAYGYKKRDVTPEMDKLSKESVTFDNAMAQSSWCLPNYASLFTGHTPEVHGQYANMPGKSLPAFETTLASKMKEAGYDTASFSGGIYMLKAWGLDKGFDHYENLFSTSQAMPASAEDTLPLATRWLDKKRRAPFFLYMAVDDLHAPYQSEDPEKYDPGYDGIAHDTDVAHVRFFRAYNGEPVADAALRKKLEVFKSSPAHLEHLKAHYDASMNSVDRKVAALVDRLKKAGVWDKTVLIVTADHGELLGEHGLLGHTEGLYEPVLRVPLIMRHPGYSHLAGRHVDTPVQRIDITPTILDVAGVSYAKEELQGLSLLPLLESPASPWREYAYASSKRNLTKVADLNIDERVVRDRRWKLHRYMYKDRYELYDLSRDPLESREVSRDNPEVLHRLSLQLMNHFERSRPHAPGMPSGKNPAGFLHLESASPGH